MIKAKFKSKNPFYNFWKPMPDEFNPPELIAFPKYLQRKGTGWHTRALGHLCISSYKQFFKNFSFLHSVKMNTIE